MDQILDLTLMPGAWVGDHVCLHAALGPVGWSIGPWSLALGVPLAPWCPPGPWPLPLAWALVLGYVVACAAFSVLALGAAKQYAARKPTICDLMLFLSA